MRDAVSGLLAIRVAAVQAAHLQDDALRANVEEALVKVAARLERRQVQANEVGASIDIGTHADNLVDAAFRTTHYAGDVPRTTVRLAELLVKLSNASPVIMHSLWTMVRRLVWEVPASQLHGIWQLQLELRARNDSAKA